MDRRPLVATVASFLVVLSGLGLWIQARNSDAEDDRLATSNGTQASAAFGAIVKRGLSEGRVSASRQWHSFSGAEAVAGGVPRRTRLAVAETLGGQAGIDALGLEFDSAHQLRTPSGFTLWMVPGRGVMCLIRMERVATTCSTKRNAIRRGLLLQTHRTSATANEPAFSTIGVMPDWATAVSLRVGSVPVTIPIMANAFDFAATRSIRVLRLTR